MLFRFFGWVLMAVFLFIALVAGYFGLLLHREGDKFAWFFFAFTGLFCLAPLYMVLDLIISLAKLAFRRGEAVEEEEEEEEEDEDEDEDEDRKKKADRWDFDVD